MIRSLSILAALLILVVVIILVPSFLRDSDSPVARMYRTEADLASLANAIDSYYDAKGMYPPPGEAGLAVALNFISQTVDYFPNGPPVDGWGRAFQYVPHFAYTSKNSGALKDGEYFAPDRYQLYSLGADGDSGKTNPPARADNITSWADDRNWRDVYKD
jgi:hypothetical protein